MNTAANKQISYTGFEDYLNGKGTVGQSLQYGSYVPSLTGNGKDKNPYLKGITSSYATDTADDELSRAKSIIKETVANSLGSGKLLGNLDKVTDDALLRGSKTAKETIDNNIRTGRLPQNAKEIYPYLTGGMTYFYAAGELGLHDVADYSRKVAYSEDKKNIKETRPKEDNKAKTIETKAVAKTTPTFEEYLLKEMNAKVSEEGFLDEFSEPEFEDLYQHFLHSQKERNKSFYPDFMGITIPKNSPLKTSGFIINLSDGSEIKPSDYLKSEMERIFDGMYAGKTTAEFILDSKHLESFHKALTDSVINAPRPNNIGKGQWAKIVKQDLAWVDEVFGKSSNFAKALKRVPYISIGVDAIKSVYDNTQENADTQEILSDVALEIGIGGTNLLVTNALLGTKLGSVGGVAGAAIGALIGIALYVLEESRIFNGKSIKDFLDEAIDWAIDGIKSWFD